MESLPSIFLLNEKLATLGTILRLAQNITGNTVKIIAEHSYHLSINMVQQKLTNYLRTFRKRSHLSQGEVAYLLGSGSGCKVSRYERFARVPNLQTAMAFEIIYGVSVKDLFAGIFRKVEKKIVGRARLLACRFGKSDSSRLSVVRLKILERFIPCREQ